jgi:response regulator RpfG family c-di-GMP phosphodiesterase
MEGDSLLVNNPMNMQTANSRRTILLVDDHPSIRMILSAGLKANGTVD